MIGQHIRILKDGRWVHAVDCGDETVLHLVEDAPPPRVRRAYRPEFVAGADAVEVVTHREPTFPPREIVKRAYSRASDPALAAMFGDSESFVEWCTSGRFLAQRNVAVEAPPVTPAAAPAPAARPRGKPTPARRKGKVAARAKVTARAKPAVKASRPAKPKEGARSKPAARGRPSVKARRAATKAPAKAKRGVKATVRAARKARR